MTSPKDYREFALDCIRWARQTKNPTHRQVMLDLARTWARTAVIAEESLVLMEDDQLEAANSKLKRLLD